MSHQQPHFTFNPHSWLSGSISSEPYITQGVFINCCCYYWVNNCEVTLLLLNIRFPNASQEINRLIEINLLVHDKDTDKISIKFLNDKWRTVQRENATAWSLFKEWIGGKMK